MPLAYKQLETGCGIGILMTTPKYPRHLHLVPHGQHDDSGISRQRGHVQVNQSAGNVREAVIQGQVTEDTSLSNVHSRLPECHYRCVVQGHGPIDGMGAATTNIQRIHRPNESTTGGPVWVHTQQQTEPLSVDSGGNSGRKTICLDGGLEQLDQSSSVSTSQHHHDVEGLPSA